jgi:hypothetical protein
MNRYINQNNIFPPQPIRVILPMPSDILHTLKHGERIDNVAFKYYNDQTLAWLIMCANPHWGNEFEVPFGAVVRVPYPLVSVFTQWQLQDANSNQNTSTNNSNSF